MENSEAVQTGRSGIRTHESRICNPLPEITKPLINQPVTHAAKNVLARRWALLAQQDARLAELIDAWAGLSHAMRQAITATVLAATKKEANE